MAYGPVNYANQGDESPFGGLDHRINYNNMVKHQMVSQYANGVLPPSMLPLQQQRQIATKERFQYGVEGGQDPRFYERQAQLSRAGKASAISQTMSSLYMYGMADVAGKALGATTLFNPISLGLMLGVGVPAYFVGQGFKRNLQRQKYMASISSDVEQYRDQLGFTGGLSYSQGTQLGRNLQESMYKPGFFNKEQKMEIHKIGLSNNLLSSKGVGSSVGNIKQYQKNVEELIATTEDIVKLLNTTKEGGMSVIKELKNSGFQSMSQIKQQVHMAKSAGGLTGIGAQNMMALGNAGAQAVQGTPWSAAVGASSYQFGAVQAQMVSNSSSAGAYAVRRVGGVAAAGAVLGNYKMNVLQSGIGSRLAAYSMNSDGSINEKKLENMLSGKASTFDIVDGANKTGFKMGENKVRFGMFKEDLWNQLSDMDRSRATMVAFDKWSEERPYSSIENKAYEFARANTNNNRELRLVYEDLLTMKDYSRLNAQAGATRAINNRVNTTTGAARLWKKTARGFNEQMDKTAGDMVRTYNDISKSVDKWMPSLTINDIYRGVTGYDMKQSVGDYTTGMENLYAINNNTQLKRASKSNYNNKGSKVTATDTSLSGKVILRKLQDYDDGDGNAVNSFLQEVSSAVIHGTTDKLFTNRGFRAAFTEGQINVGKKNSQGFALEVLTTMNKTVKDHETQLEDSSSKFNAFVKKMPTEEAREKAYKWKKEVDFEVTKNGSFEWDDRRSYGSARTMPTVNDKMWFGGNDLPEGFRAYGKAVNNYASTKKIDKQMLQQAEVAAAFNIKTKYTELAFLPYGKNSFDRGVFPEYNFDKEKDKAEFVAQLAHGRDTGDRRLETKASDAGMPKFWQNELLKEYDRSSDAMSSRAGALKTQTFMNQFDPKDKDYDRLTKLSSNIYGGTLSPDDIKSLSWKDLGEKVYSKLGGSKGLFKRNIAEALKTGDTSTVQKMFDDDSAKKERTRRQVLVDDIAKLDQIINKNGTVHLDSNNRTMKTSWFGENDRIEAMLTRAELQGRVDKADQNEEKYRMPSTVRSPVLNYWNNRWVL